jgi:hypothetical protein
MTAYMASFSSGINTRLETKPGASFTSTGVFSSFEPGRGRSSKAACEVASPRITSTSFITGTGLKKCMPMTLSGRLVSAASFVIEIEEVLEARMTSGRLHHAIEVSENLRLDFESFRRGLDYEIAIGEFRTRSTPA